MYERHYSLLRDWNQRINLVSRKSFDNAFAAHYIDSIYISDATRDCAPHLKVFDIGSGAGFPGVICAIRYPGRSVTLYEKSLKKQSFLSEVLADLGLPNLRLEGAIPEKKQDGIYLARAVFPRQELFSFMRDRMTASSLLVTNLGGTHPVQPPPPDFRVMSESAYTLPLDCGGRKSELLQFVPRGTN